MADRRLQVFHTVAKQLSFTKAAELLCMTQPAVTFQVKQLEEHYNTRLFERHHGRISLTPAGETVFAYAERILALGRELDTRVNELTGEVGGPLLLGASMTIAEYILPRVLGEFRAQHPQVRAQLTVANSETIESRVADRTLDLGLIESPAHLPGLHTEPLGEDELVMVCAPGHPLAGKAEVTPPEIAANPYVWRESGSGTREFAEQYFREQGIAPDDFNVVMELGSPEAIKGLIETGIAVAVMSRATLYKETRLRTLVAVPLRPRLIRTFSLVYPEERFRSRLVSAFAAYATSRMRDGALAA
ncbi:MAG: LysR substrate-binding domain-containing protein [Burkholderiales bacterium]